jgi:NADP-dependent 3-hydroxy acid dehydrogenase YdfG
MTPLAGKVAVVTGASRGIGAAIARRLSAEGVRLGLASRSGDDLGLPDTVSTSWSPTPGRAYGPFAELPPEQLEEMIDTNVKGVLHAAASSVPHLLARGGGDVVSLASEAGPRGLPNEAVYCASKFAQVGFTRALDHELRPHGIRCTNVYPGGVATDFAMGEGRGRTPEMPELAGMMSAEDVADAVLFVLTRPRSHRILEVAFRPMSEGSWG